MEFDLSSIPMDIRFHHIFHDDEAAAVKQALKNRQDESAQHFLMAENEEF